MRKSTAAATATTAAAMEARVRAVVAGQAVPPKHPAQWFPEFQPSVMDPGAERPQQGWSDFCYSVSGNRTGPDKPFS